MYACIYFHGFYTVSTIENFYERENFSMKINKVVTLDDNNIMLVYKHMYRSGYNNQYTSLTNTFFIKNVVYANLCEQEGISSLKGATLSVLGQYKPFVKPSNPGRLNIHLSNLPYKRVGKFYAKEIIVSKTGSKINYFTNASSIRNSIDKNLKSIFRDDTYGLVKAMLLGDKSNISDEYMEKFKQHGISHIIAISGLHIGILYLVMSKLFNAIVKNQKACFWLTTCFIIGYNFLIELNISSVRASLMLTIYYVSIVYCLPYNKVRGFLITFCSYIILRPQDIFNLGFQLSYLAVWSLFYIYPVMVQRLIPNSISYKLKEFLKIILVTISINIGTMPVLMLYFGGISFTSIVANMMIVPVVFYIYLGGIISLILYSIIPIVGTFVAGSVDIMVGYYSFVFEVLKNYKYIYLKRPDIIDIGLYYGILLSVIYKYNNKEGVK